jgi:Tol biopolymer transport system component
MSRQHDLAGEFNLRYMIIIFYIALISVFLLNACTSKMVVNELMDPAVSFIRTDMTLFFTQPAWNPNGKSIAVVGATICQGMCPYSIYAVDPLNGHTWQLVNKTAMEPSWTSDGRLSFYYEAPDPPSGMGIYITTLPSFNPVLFQKNIVSVAWSPDGKLAAIVESRYDKTTNLLQSHLEVTDLESAENKQIFETPWAQSTAIGSVNWSSNGDTLVFTTGWSSSGGNTGENHLYTIQSDGSQLRSHGNGIDGIKNAGWMINNPWLYITFGTKEALAFLNIQNDYVINSDIDGIDESNLSPDGTKLAFTHDGALAIIDLKKLLGQNFEKLSYSK